MDVAYWEAQRQLPKEVPLPESDSESDYDARTSRETSRLPEDINFDSGFMELSRSRSPSPSPPREVSLYESQERGVSESEFTREIKDRLAALKPLGGDEEEKTPSESDESEDEPILPAVDPDFVISPPKTLMQDAAEVKGEQAATMIVVGLIFLAAANYLT